MAWRSNGTTNAEMVEALWKNGLLKQEAVRDAFLAIDRRWFIPRSIPESYAAAYKDIPQQIGYNVTNSAPHMLCIMTEIVVDHAGGTLNGKKILDIGSGSGMLTTVFAHLGGDKCQVIGVDHVPQLVEWGMSVTLERFPEWCSGPAPRLQFLLGDGRLGLPQHAPFDVIHVGAAAPEIPDVLVAQIALGGIMVIPVGVQEQALIVVKKDLNGKVTTTNSMGVRFGLLTDLSSQLKR